MGPKLTYETWQKFEPVVDKAERACVESGYDPSDHFIRADEMIATGKGATRTVEDVHLSRYGCYLVAMNGDPRKPEVAAAQTYFAIKTREAEMGAVAKPDDDLDVQLQALMDARKRLIARSDSHCRPGDSAVRLASWATYKNDETGSVGSGLTLPRRLRGHRSRWD